MFRSHRGVLTDFSAGGGSELDGSESEGAEDAYEAVYEGANSLVYIVVGMEARGVGGKMTDNTSWCRWL